MRIDSHQHFWQIGRADYSWLNQESHPRIYRDFVPGDLEPLLAQYKVDRTILVQAAPALAETLYLLEIAHRTSFVAGVVGWVDFEARNVAAAIEDLARDELIVGVRPMIQDLSDDEWMLSPNLANALQEVAHARLRFDALVKPRHLPVLLKFMLRYPDLHVVIDHGAKPHIASAEISIWAEGMRNLARETHACCKLSGLVTEAGPSWSLEKLAPYVETLLELFGPGRLMWGSDWPVLNEAGDYGSWFATVETLTRSLSEKDRKAIFGETAARFYGVAE